jgi:hypothetical protein
MSKLKYADIVKKSVNNVLPESDGDDNERFFKNDFQSTNDYTSTKPSYIWRRDSNYNTWERSYFRILLELRNVFIDRILELNPLMENYLRSPQFFKKFNFFIYKNSSTKISNFLEPLDNELENLYSEYKEKSNWINEQEE